MEIEWSERHEHFASARWSRSETDFLGRIISESRPGFGGSTLITSNTYNTAGQLVATVSLSTRSTCSTRLNSRLYLYDELNDRVATVSDRNFNNAVDWAGPDLVSSNATRYRENRKFHKEIMDLQHAIWEDESEYNHSSDRWVEWLKKNGGGVP